MNIVERLKTGLNIGAESFGLLWRHKKLIIYLGAPILLGITFELIAYNLFFYSPLSSALFVRGLMTTLWSTFGWTQQAGLLLTNMIRIFVTVYASVMLAYHTSRILQGKPAGIKASFAACMPIYKKVLAWAAIATVAFFIIDKIDYLVGPSACAGCKCLGATASLLVRGFWALFTVFVIPALALETYPLKKIILNSPRVLFAVFFRYLGAIFWIGLVGLLAFTPFLLLFPKTPFFLTLVYIALAPISFTLSTVHTIVKTRLYVAYK